MCVMLFGLQPSVPVYSYTNHHCNKTILPWQRIKTINTSWISVKHTNSDTDTFWLTGLYIHSYHRSGQVYSREFSGILHQVFYASDALPVIQPTASKHRWSTGISVVYKTESCTYFQWWCQAFAEQFCHNEWQHQIPAVKKHLATWWRHGPQNDEQEAEWCWQSSRC